MEFHHIVPHDGDMDGDVERNEDSPSSLDPPIWSEVMTSLSYHCFVSDCVRAYNLLLIKFCLSHSKYYLKKHFPGAGVLILISILLILTWQIMRFFSNPRKPMILALARADPKKNITTLVKAFGECRPLRELANLVCTNP